MSPGAHSRKQFFNKSYFKLEKGSVKGSIFSLCSAAIGGGVLSLPYMFVLVGWGMGYVLLITGAVSGIWSNLIIANLSVEHRIPNYEAIAEKAGGNCLKKTLQWMVLFYVFGTCVGYQIVLSTLASYVAQAIGASVDFTSSYEFRAFVNLPIAAIVLMPLSMMRDLSSLAFASVLSLLALAYTGIVMFVELPWYSKEYRAMDTTDIQLYNF